MRFESGTTSEGGRVRWGDTLEHQIERTLAERYQGVAGIGATTPGGVGRGDLGTAQVTSSAGHGRCSTHWMTGDSRRSSAYLTRMLEDARAVHVKMHAGVNPSRRAWAGLYP